MKTLDLSLEDGSFADLDAVSRAAGMTPAEFARRATEAAIRRHKARDAARRDIAGYEQAPAGSEEFAMDEPDLEGAGSAAQ